MAFLHEAGTAGSNGMGISGLSWTEIKNWKELTGITATDFEISMIKKMSDAYATEYSLSSDADRSAPYSPSTVEDIERNREIVSNKVESMFAAFMEEE